MTEGRSGINKGVSGHRYKFPIITKGTQCHFENAKAAGTKSLAVRIAAPAEDRQAPAACSDNDLSNALHKIKLTVGILGGKPFIEMVVRDEKQIGMVSVESLHKGLYLSGPPSRSRGVIAVMPIGECAWMGTGSKILSKPLFLRRTRFTTSDICTIAIEGDQMPCPKIVTVVSPFAVSEVPCPMEVVKEACPRVMIA